MVLIAVEVIFSVYNIIMCFRAILSKSVTANNIYMLDS